MSELSQVSHYIDGQYREGPDTFDVLDPGRPAETVAQVAEGGLGEAEAAVAAAERATVAWGSTPVGERVELVEAGLRAVEAVADELAVVLVRENGALLAEARLDIDRGLGLDRHMLGLAEEALRPIEREASSDRVVIYHKPVGPVAMVVPWNSPIVLAASKFAPALVAGNPVIVKPSPEAPVTLSRIMSLLGQALPPGVVNVVNSSGAAGPALSAHPRVRKVSFTGSIEVGRQVMAAAATNLKRVSLELGGNDAALVLADADLDAVIEPIARGIFTRAGQICFAVKRVFVAQELHREFVSRLTAFVDEFQVGYGLDPNSTFGPLINGRQLDRVNRLVKGARDSGATIHELGRISDEGLASGGHYRRPVVVEQIDVTDDLVTEEQFGPVIPVLPFQNLDEAIGAANATEFGLASSIWTSDPEAAFHLATRLEAGVTFVNSHNLWSLSFDLPFGGVKQSGIGRERSTWGVREYVEPQAVRWIKPS